MDALLQNIRHTVVRRAGPTGIRGLQRSFRIMDDNHSLTLSPDEFRAGLADYDVNLSDEEFYSLLQWLDTNGDGQVQIGEFFLAIRGGMNPRRRAVVHQCFTKFDKDKTGVIDVDDMKKDFDVSRHPQVMNGEKTKQEVMQDFLKTFDDPTNPDGSVTWAEFEAYYCGLSCTIDNDEYFELMMASVWKLDEDNLQQAREDAKNGLFATQPDIRNHIPLSAIPPQRAAKSKPPKRIVGYTGHVPGSKDTYGITFDRSERESVVPAKKNQLPPPPAGVSATQLPHLPVKKSPNAHSYRLE
eukprot:NODE_896_length_1250_cov_291.457952_g682_i0.p1 GENE.NODE_896_length_1250_cov_291.457952_g682_i0~~NODE_896_length_1250_cov_291.457952_g682_i0.p1  ORF type:complete len:298 (-),score=57.67 NODE_896_length_1250_cov_291.457952_g682_i0:252-1145(-)